jgi:hypothetical protein
MQVNGRWFWLLFARPPTSAKPVSWIALDQRRQVPTGIEDSD